MRGSSHALRSPKSLALRVLCYGNKRGKEKQPKKKQAVEPAKEGKVRYVHGLQRSRMFE